MSSANVAKLSEFAKFATTLKGTKRDEAHVFSDRLFQAFGYAGVAQAGARLDDRAPKRRGGIFANVLWEDRGFQLEVMRRGEKLQRHYHHSFFDWTLHAPRRPQ